MVSALQVVRTLSPGSRPCQFFPPPHPSDWSLNPLEQAYLQSGLKSFITAFIQNNEGLEYKLTRAPLKGLAKSMYCGQKTTGFEERGRRCVVMFCNKPKADEVSPHQASADESVQRQWIAFAFLHCRQLRRIWLKNSWIWLWASINEVCNSVYSSVSNPWMLLKNRFFPPSTSIGSFHTDTL